MSPPLLPKHIVFLFYMVDGVTHSIVEAHGRNITFDCCIFLVAAAQRIWVKVALGQRLFKPGALHLVHVDRSDACRYTLGTLKKMVIKTQLKYSCHVHYREEML